MIQFSYRGFHGCTCVCGLELQKLADGRTLVICTELPENTGTSVTNFAENLATLVCRKFGIRHDQLLWIEHYFSGRALGPEPQWDWVEFDWDGESFQNPRWRPMDALDWRQLGLVAPAR